VDCVQLHCEPHKWVVTKLSLKKGCEDLLLGATCFDTAEDFSKGGLFVNISHATPADDLVSSMPDSVDVVFVNTESSKWLGLH